MEPKNLNFHPVLQGSWCCCFEDLSLRSITVLELSRARILRRAWLLGLPHTAPSWVWPEHPSSVQWDDCCLLPSNGHIKSLLLHRGHLNETPSCRGQFSSILSGEIQTPQGKILPWVFALVLTILPLTTSPHHSRVNLEFTLIHIFFSKANNLQIFVPCCLLIADSLDNPPGASRYPCWEQLVQNTDET